MGNRVRAVDLLSRAAAIYDAAGNPLAPTAGRAWHTFFQSGGQWMQAALEHVRGSALPGTSHSLQKLGCIKYCLACLGALACVALAWQLAEPWILIGCVPIFYAIEAQFVFLFPLALDGDATPLRSAWQWTRHAGGTWAVMRVVLPLAGVMLFGGLAGRGFVRCWCLGCLAVCLWYEVVRASRPNALPSDKRTQ